MPVDAEPRRVLVPVFLGIAAAISLTLLFQIGALLFTAIGRGSSSDASHGLTLTAIGVAQLAMMFLPTILLAPPVGPRASPLLRFRPVTTSAILATVVGTLAMWGLTQSWLLVQEVFLIPSDLVPLYRELTSGTEEKYNLLFRAPTTTGMIASLVVGALIPALSEETLFRGLVQSLFERALRPIAAIGLAAFMFALLHLQPFMIVPLFALGAFFGYFAWRSGSIIPPIVGHLLFNAISLVALQVPGYDGAAAPDLHTADDLVVVAPVTMLSVVAMAGVMWFVERTARSRSTSHHEHNT